MAPFGGEFPRGPQTANFDLTVMRDAAIALQFGATRHS
jgi:hypothetical protein